MDFSLLQPHTVNLYDLTNKTYTIERVKAKSLLSPLRFDLFAKLYYAKHRDDDPTKARHIYIEHIKAFNPDGREPGRDDKISFEDFIRIFDSLLDYFKENNFDEKESIVPLSSNGIILDGAHRVAALAYYNKEITIARFNGVVSVCQFDYLYFKMRGLSQEVSDTIAKEILNWTPYCFVACLWPKMGDDKKKEMAIDRIKRFSTVFYAKKLHCSLSSFGTFIARIYQGQSWVGSEKNGFAGAMDKALNCYDTNKNIDFVFFQSNKMLDEILELKEEIRNLFIYGKHSLHITDNDEETKDIAYLVLSKEGLSEWLYKHDSWGYVFLIRDIVREKIYIFKKVHWIRFKTFFYSFLIRK